jgi:hypothetical protein
LPLNVFSREMQEWNNLYCIVLMAQTEALSFF